MKLRPKWWLSIAVVALLVGGALQVVAGRNAKKAALEAQQATQKAQVTITLAPSDVVRVQSIPLTQGIAITGSMNAVNSAFVKARIAGEVQGLVVREGDFVQAGQVIARIDAADSQARVRQAQQQAEAAKAQVTIAKRTFENNQSLVAQGFISQTALESSTAALASAQATYNAAQAAADVAAKALSDTVLVAPISGHVAQRLVQAGERVAVDTRMVEIVDLQHLEMVASLSAADSLAVKVGQKALLDVEGSATRVQAQVVRINPSATAASRAVLAYLRISPTAGLRHGLFAQGVLTTNTMQTLAVPLTAVRTDKPQPYVQWIHNNQVVHQVVTLGARGEYQGVPMVSMTELAEGAVILSGLTGSLREGTRVQLPAASGAQ